MNPTLTVERGTLIGGYTDPAGHEREIVQLPAVDGTLLVDQTVDGGDARLIARVEADEPDGNVDLLTRIYLADPARGRCGAVRNEDRFPAPEERCDMPWTTWLAPCGGDVARLALTPTEKRALAVRWTIDTQVVSLRTVVAAMQDYEPAVTLTRAALQTHADERGMATSVLAAELGRLLESPVLLNRRLRERVERTVAAGVSMSEIAQRCGRLKRTPSGTVSGDTSWLARRIGHLPEAGHDRPTPWVHTGVLALIARDGLGIAPREVELPVGAWRS